MVDRTTQNVLTLVVHAFLLCHCISKKNCSSPPIRIGIRIMRRKNWPSTRRGIIHSTSEYIIQFKCNLRGFREDLTLVLEEPQCFSSISKPSSEIRKTNFRLFRSRQRIFRCALFSHLSHL